MKPAKSEQTARPGEKILVVIAVLAAFALGILITGIDAPVAEAVSRWCDQGHCVDLANFSAAWNGGFYYGR